ncbi:MAG: hypothetical protein JWQ35_1541 [Bacteriovoracaceae bacterium]|nr:hypothetical protein [Bacteriovoracaceae bacterium]
MKTAKVKFLILLGTSLFFCKNLTANAGNGISYNPYLSLPLTTAAATTFLSFSLLEDKLAPRKCRWCDRNAQGLDDLNGFDSSIRKNLKWAHQDLASKLSHLTAFGLLPLGIISAEFWMSEAPAHWDRFVTDSLIIFEATSIAGVIGSGVQFAVGRERPYAHDLPAAERLRLPDSRNTSFYSGHANLAFALVVSSGTLATIRNDSLAPYLWTGGLILAGTTAYLRIASDRHYATDVIAGAAAGSLIGFSVPYFLHREVKYSTEKKSMNLMNLGILPTTSGMMAEAEWRF